MRRFSTRSHTTIAALVFISLIPFIRLGDGDLHSDEVIYASRAQEVLATGNLLPKVPLRLMFGNQPPLAIWAMALLVKVFGFSAFSVRLVSALSAVVLVLVIYRFALLVLPPTYALGAAAMLASSSLLMHFAQMAQLDVPWLACVALAFLLFWHSLLTDKKYLFVASAIVFGISFNVKLFVSILPLMALLAWVVVNHFSGNDHNEKLTIRRIGQYLGIIAIVALPWHLWAMITYGSEFFDIILRYEVVERTLKGIGAAQDSGKLYYGNQLLVGFPLGMIAATLFVYRLNATIRNRTVAHIEGCELFLWLWLCLPLLALLMMRTQLQSYAIQLVPSLALLAIIGVSTLSRYGVNGWWRFAAMFGCAAACGWGVSQTVRDGARMLFAGAARAPVSSASFIIVAGVTAAVALAVFYLLKWKPKLLANLFLMIPTIGAAFFIGVRTLDVVADPLAHPATGARVIATSFPGSMYGAIITPQISMQDAVMQFHCYDSSKTLYARLSYYDLHAYVKTPVMLPDSDHYAILELPNAYLANDSSGVIAARYLREQQYVVILPTNNFILFARGLYRE